MNHNHNLNDFLIFMGTIILMPIILMLARYSLLVLAINKT
jgi:hypothetical protein